MQKNILNIYFEKITIRNQPDFLSFGPTISHSYFPGFRTVVAAIYWPQLAKLQRVSKWPNLTI